MAVRIKDLPLNELYTKKITGSVEAAIHEKENFSSIAPNYCEAVCKLKVKAYDRVILLKQLRPDEPPIDILIVQDHSAPKGKYDKRPDQQELIQRKIIEFVCQKAGFQGLNYRLVNLLKCGTSEQDFPKGKSPSVSVLNKCRPYVLDEIRRMKPRMIISLSTAVTKSLGLSKMSNTNNRGEIFNTDFEGTVIPVLITLHPRVLTMIRQNASGVMWGNDYFNIIRRDFHKAVQVLTGKIKLLTLDEGISKQKPHIKIARSIEDVQEITSEITSLPHGFIVSLDTETTGLDGMAPNAKLITIQFGWLDPKTRIYKAGVIPLWHRENKAYNADEAWKLVTPILLNKDILKILHNAKFDILYIYHTTGIRLEGFEVDTMLALHALDSGIQGCLSLKTAVWDHCLDLGLGGYEEKLPKLTKPKKVKASDGDEESEENEETEGEE